jgi:hypothetical protein
VHFTRELLQLLYLLLMLLPLLVMPLPHLIVTQRLIICLLPF